MKELGGKMKRTNGEILRDLRKKNNLTMEELGKRLGISTGFINNMEKGKKPIPQLMLEKIIDMLKASEYDINELRRNIIEENLPKTLKKGHKEIEFKNITTDLKMFKHKVYEFNTNLGGVIDVRTFREEYFMLYSNIKEGSLIIEVIGKGLEPFFYEGDRILFENEKFQNWEIINKKLVAFKYNEEYMVRKVKFQRKKPYLLAIETDVYEDIDILENEKDILYIGQMSRLLDRDLKKMTFE